MDYRYAQYSKTLGLNAIGPNNDLYFGVVKYSFDDVVIKPSGIEPLTNRLFSCLNRDTKLLVEFF